MGWYQRVPTAELETAAGTVPVRLIRPLVYGERQAWGALEWLCFYVLKFSFDALLVRKTYITPFNYMQTQLGSSRMPYDRCRC